LGDLFGWKNDLLSVRKRKGGGGVIITLAGIAFIIMPVVYPTMRESLYPNSSSVSRDIPEASGRLLRNLKEFTFQDMAN